MLLSKVILFPAPLPCFFKVGHGGKKKKKDKKKKKKKDKKKKKKKDKKKDKKKKGGKLAGAKHFKGQEGLDLYKGLVAILVENHIIKAVNPKANIANLVGDYNLLGTALLAKPEKLKRAEPENERHDWDAEAKTGDRYWVKPLTPSMEQIRAAVTEYCILPQGSAFVKANTPLIRSVLLYGPSGVGKTMIAEAVAAQTGALFLDFSAENLKDAPTDKKETEKLIHAVFEVAKHKAMQPAVIYIDQCDKFFGGGKGKKGKGGGGKDAPTRFSAKNMLRDYVKSLTEEHQVIVIGTSRLENDNVLEDKVIKELNSVFDRKLYVPAPGYESRLLMWKKCLREALGTEVPHTLEVSTLAFITEGYTNGAIEAAVKKHITRRRLARIEKEPLTAEEFLGVIAKQFKKATYSEETHGRGSNKVFEQFMTKIGGPSEGTLGSGDWRTAMCGKSLSEVRESSGDDDGGGEKKSGGKKKKGK